MKKTLIALCLFLNMSVAQAEEFKYQGKVIKVIDGDTIEVEIAGWPAPYNPISVRIYGIDTPESKHGIAKCDKELKLGVISKAWAKKNLPVDTLVTIVWAGKKEKYGRLLGNVILPSGKDFAKEQIKVGNARAYFGEKKSDWCK